MKKSVRVLLGILGFLVLASIVLPYFLKGRLADSLKRQINEQLHAHVDFKEVDLKLLRNFPDITLRVDGLSVVNKEPFEGDTLFYAGTARIDLPLKTLFASGVDPYTVNYFGVEQAKVRLITDEQGRTNYDIAKKGGSDDDATDKGGAEDGGSEGGGSSGMDPVLRLKAYAFEQVDLIYEDRTQGLKLLLDSLYHRGEGDLSAQRTVLRTDTRALLSVWYGEVAYLNRNAVDWQADIDMDLEAMTFAFKENTAHINRLPLVFEGGVALPEEGVEVDLRFGTPSTDFKQFLSLVPEAYSGNLDGVDTGGSFSVNGTVKGVLDEERIPRFDIAVDADRAHFKYNGMPLGMEEITLKSRVANTTENAKDTYMTIDTLHFKVAGDPMDVKLKAEALGDAPRVALDARGKLNLANFAGLMPAEILRGLQGVLKIDMSSQFDMEDIEKENYAAVRNKGVLQVSNMKFSTAYLPEEVLVEHAEMELRNATMTLKDSRILTGASDLRLKGQIRDYFMALSETGVVKGELEMVSDHLEVSDLLAEAAATTDATAMTEAPEGAKGEGEMKGPEEPLLPANLQLKVSGRASEVVYDGITLKNASASMLLADQKLQIRDLSSDVFGGRIGLGGVLDGASSTPEYDMDLKASGFDFSDAFAQMDLLKNLMPLARALEGELNGSMHLSGILGEDLSPVLSSLSGFLQGDLKVEEVRTGELGFVQSLNNTFSLVDLSALGGKVLKGSFDFDDGKVRLKPMRFEVKGMNATLGGSHAFNGKMDYTMTLDVPASYLGDEITKQATILGIKDLDKRTIPVDLLIGGEISDPSFTTNMDKAASDFVAQLANEKKDELVEKGKGELNTLVNKVLGTREDKATDTVAQEKDEVQEAAKTLLNNLFKKKKDTTGNR